MTPPRTETRRARTAWVLLLLLAAATAGWVWMEPDRLRSWAQPRPTRPTDDDFARLARAHAEATAPPPNQGPWPAREESPESTEIPFYGFCPDEGEAPARFKRPSLFEFLQLRSHELLDRARAAQRKGKSSPRLRRGLRQVLSRDDSDRGLELLAMAPDRHDGDFDYAVAAATVLGGRALGEGNLDAAVQYARFVAEEASDDLAARALDALVARRTGDLARERDALWAAYRADPGEPVVALALGRNLAHTSDLDPAITALDGYLVGAPQDVPMARLRARLDTQRQIQRDYGSVDRGGVTLLWPRNRLPDSLVQSVLLTVRTSLDEAARLTGMQRRAELLVVVYTDRSELLATTCVPSWTAGVFDGTLRLHAGSLRDTRSRNRVIRHEVLHAQLRSRPIEAPHWFHEGLAQYFARESGRAHARSYRMMLRNRTYIPFASLDGSFLVIDRSRDANLAYHQSLAMIELMILHGGRNPVATAVRYLDSGQDPAAVLDHVTAPTVVDGDDLLTMLRERLEAGR